MAVIENAGPQAPISLCHERNYWSLNPALNNHLGVIMSCKMDSQVLKEEHDYKREHSEVKERRKVEVTVRKKDF